MSGVVRDPAGDLPAVTNEMQHAGIANPRSQASMCRTSDAIMHPSQASEANRTATLGSRSPLPARKPHTAN